MEQTLLSLRKQIIEKNFARLNSMQLQAVTSVNGPLLILAGAGSGKTTVLVNRIACLIRYGNAYHSDVLVSLGQEDPEGKMRRYLQGDASIFGEIAPMLSVDAPQPWQILAITFTNKAANELKERLVSMLGEPGDEIWASTFHSACVRILRREADRLGYTSHFTIYDTDDTKRVIKECQRQLHIDDKILSHKTIMNEISRAKDELTGPEDYNVNGKYGPDPKRRDVAAVYKAYQKQLMEADAMDFDDIIVNTVRLFRENEDVLSYYQRRFRYIMVDEYQDTNHAQYVLVSLLAAAHQNLCVVGDDDQSIYSFRGANIENILSFEKQFPGAEVIRLEENYRSTQTILDAANAVIANNEARKGKNLWTANGKGDKIEVHVAADDLDEGRFIADSVIDKSADGRPFSDFAVLYRTNAQSNVIERALVRASVPYRIIGGHRFYDRKEIRDAVAYLSVVLNHNDNVRLRRIINEPKRGIGDTTINNVASIASLLGESMFEVMKHADEYAPLSRSAAKLRLITEMIESFSDMLGRTAIAEVYREIMTQTGYVASLAQDPETKEDRTQNLDELYSTIARYEEENGDNATLGGFLEEAALQSDIDNYDETLETVTLMTLHSAKGLEFPVVFLPGMENGLFPSQQSIGDPFELEEERRLAYVGITRAKTELIITRANSRMQFGKTVWNPPSVFLEEIPRSLLNDTSPRRASYGGFGGYGGSGYGGGWAAKGSRNQYADDFSSYGSKSSYGSSSYRSPDSDRFDAIIGKKPAAEKEPPAPAQKLGPGDRVSHKKFGVGMVLSAVPLGNDVLLEVAFETSGTKKLMQKAARLEKLG
ncbi:MAG: UvrD-helicase domain-containing protein [Clostridia bacterium]|nr:UvrD-helicase domain-containing protein [Clostridia bacterium]